MFGTLFSISLCCLLTSDPNTYTVDCSGNGNFTTIQSAIDSVPDGSTIVVLPNTCNAQGRYLENIKITNRNNLTLRSLNPSDPQTVEATIIDGSLGITVPGNNDSTITVIGSTVILDGLSITGGSGKYDVVVYPNNIDLFGWKGGGVWIDGHFPGSDDCIVRSCNIYGNKATRGAGMFVTNGNPKIIRCHIYENNTFPLTGQGGILGGSRDPGVELFNTSGLLDRCVIENNVADLQQDLPIPDGFVYFTGAGVGIRRKNAGPDTMEINIVNTIITNNSTVGFYGEPTINVLGGAISAIDFKTGGGAIQVNVLNSQITNNNTHVAPGLSFCTDPAAVMPNMFNVFVSGCTIAYNVGHTDPPLTTIQNMNLAPAIVQNSIVWGNAPSHLLDPKKNGPLFMMDTQYSYSDVWDADGLPEGPGIISEDPLFLESDFHLSADSPCIDAGNPALRQQICEVDIDGQFRVLGQATDMGADETAYGLLPADFNYDGKIDGADLGLLLANWGDGNVEFDLNKDGLINGADLGLMLSSWGQSDHPEFGCE